MLSFDEQPLLLADGSESPGVAASSAGVRASLQQAGAVARAQAHAQARARRRSIGAEHVVGVVLC